MKPYKKNKGVSKSNEKKLSDNEINSLIKIFEDKKWDIDSALFENFCNTLELLDEEQRELVIELTKDFKSIGVESYYHYFISSFDKYVEELSKDYQGKINIFILPLISTNDFGKIKSSTLLYYILKSKSSDLINRHKQKGFSVSLIDTTNYNNIDNRYIEQMTSQNSRICLIDDFVGSGESAVSAAGYLVGIYSLNKEQISVVSLVSMRQGVEVLKSKNYKSYSNIVCTKAISGTGDREIERKQVMCSISEKIGAKPDIYLGYNQSEALIKMERTPNNTFPIYWLKNKKIKTPPFPR